MWMDLDLEALLQDDKFNYLNEIIDLDENDLAQLLQEDKFNNYDLERELVAKKTKREGNTVLKKELEGLKDYLTPYFSPNGERRS